MKNSNNISKAGMLFAMLCVSASCSAAGDAIKETVSRNPFIDTLPVVFADGSMVQATGGAYYPVGIEYSDAAFNSIKTVAINSQAHELLWIKAAPDGTTWVMDEDNHLFSYSHEAGKVTEISLTANKKQASLSEANDNGAIVNTSNELVIYNRFLEALVSYDVAFNISQQLTYAGCEAQYGYFTCKDSDQNISYVDANSFNISVDKPLNQLTSDYVVTHENTGKYMAGTDRLLIHNKQGDELFNLVTATFISGYAISKSHISLVVSDGTLYIYDWQKKLIVEDNVSHGGVVESIAYHPSGYLMLNRNSDWSSRFYPIENFLFEELATGRYYVDRTADPYNATLPLSNDYYYDYLNSNNPELVKNHQVSATNFSSTAEVDNNSSEDNNSVLGLNDVTLPDNNLDTGSSGGSTGLFALISGLLLLSIRKKTCSK